MTIIPKCRGKAGLGNGKIGGDLETVKPRLRPVIRLQP